MNKEQKYQVIEKVAGCKTLEMFESVCEELSEEEILYAKCVWVCKKYQSNRSKDKENKLKRVCEENNIDLEEMIAFSKTNLKHNETDRHFANIIKLDKKLNDEKNLQDKLDFIGEKAIEIVPIDNPSVYDGDDQVEQYIQAYAYNYGKFHLDNEPLKTDGFGHKLRVKRFDNIGYKFNAVIVSQRIVDKKLYTSTQQCQIHEELNKDFSITKNFNKFYRQDILDKLDEDGLIKIGTIVRDGDILIGGVVPDTDISSMSEEVQLLARIFGQKLTKDSPIYSKINCGKVSDVFRAKEKTNTIVDIVIDKTYDLGIGDFLGDVFNKGKIVEIISEEEMINRFGENFDLIANFSLGDYVTRYNPIAQESLIYSIGENYSLINQQPTGYNDVLKPITINESVLNKFMKHGMQEALTEVIKYSLRSLPSKTVTMQVIENGYYSEPSNDVMRIRYLKNYLYALGLELSRTYIAHNEYKYEIKKICDIEKEAISCGEVTCPESYNYRTHKPETRGLFAEEIFGPVVHYRCRCGKFNKQEHAGIVCDKCGVEVSSNFVRNEKFGHIELAIEVESIFGNKTKMILVMPPNQRPFIFSDKAYSSEINEFYRTIVNANNRVKKIIELGAPEVIIENEKDRLRRVVKEYELKVVNTIIRYIKTFIQNNKIVYALKGVGAVKKQLDNTKCLIPTIAAIKLFEPYIIRELKSKYGKTKEIFTKLRTLDPEIMDLLPKVSKGKKLVVFSNNAEGKILYLDIGFTKENSIIISEDNYEQLNINDDFINAFIPMTEKCEKKIAEKNNVYFAVENDEKMDLIKSTVVMEMQECMDNFIKNFSSKEELQINTKLGQFIIKTIL